MANNARGLRFVAAIGLAAAMSVGCGLDTDRAAPPVAPAPTEGPCRGTADLIPNLLEFVSDGRLAPVKSVIEQRFLPSPSQPNPEPSLRSVAAAALRLVSALGLEQTAFLVQIAASDDIEEGLGPVVSRFLAFIDGRVDRRDHYDASDASAWFVARCDPDFLLTGIERLLRLESPSSSGPWLVAVVEAFDDLAADPTIAPFLSSFDGMGGQGRPAVISLLVQIMTLTADPNFDIARIETLLDSAVYPLVDPPLEARIRKMMVLLSEATDPAAAVLIPLQGSLRCGLQHPDQRDVLLGTIYDLLLARSLGTGPDEPGGLGDILDVLRRPVVADQLNLLADAVAVVRDDLDGRDDLRDAAVVLLSTPDVRALVPVSIELIDEGVAAELVAALADLLITCAEDS